MSVSMPPGTTAKPLGHVDLVSPEDIRLLVRTAGPCVSFFVPTARFGPETLSGPARLRHLVAEAREALSASGTSPKEADALLAPAQSLMADEPFWQRQSDGLALYCAPGFSAHFRVPVAFAEEVAVGRTFRVRPLLPLSTADGLFYVLALAQNSVRTFMGTRQTVGELLFGEIPQSMQEAIPQEEMQRYGQSHSTGRASAAFHGHGNEADYDKAALERFFRAVDAPLTARLGGAGAPVPLVLACVAYYAPLYRQVSRYPLVWDRAVEGNPEGLAPAQLHDAAWPLVADHFADQERQWLERYHHQQGTGRTAAGTPEVPAAARDGRIDTLLLDDSVMGGTELDDAVAETLRHDGRVVHLAATDLGPEAAALLRW